MPATTQISQSPRNRALAGLTKQLKECVLKEILEPEFGFGLPGGLRERTLFKIRRWFGSIWKHKLCYKESAWSAFWSGIWSHLLKPSSI